MATEKEVLDLIWNIAKLTLVLGFAIVAPILYFLNQDEVKAGLEKGEKLFGSASPQASEGVPTDQNPTANEQLQTLVSELRKAMQVKGVKTSCFARVFAKTATAGMKRTCSQYDYDANTGSFTKIDGRQSLLDAFEKAVAS
jgi:hypothetical protein